MSDTTSLIEMLQKQLARNDELASQHEAHYQDMKHLATHWANTASQLLGMSAEYTQSSPPKTDPEPEDPAITGGEIY